MFEKYAPIGGLNEHPEGKFVSTILVVPFEIPMKQFLIWVKDLFPLFLTIITYIYF